MYLQRISRHYNQSTINLNQKLQPLFGKAIIHSCKHGKQTLYSNTVINSRPILQKSISMSTLSTSVQVITKNKTYYLKTNLGLMKTRGEILSATLRIRKFKKVREIFE